MVADLVGKHCVLPLVGRKILIVALPTGTGWLDPGAVDTVEYMHGGDIATIAVQYSYLQSPLALILETNSGLDQAEALMTAALTAGVNVQTVGKLSLEYDHCANLHVVQVLLNRNALESAHLECLRSC